MFEKIFKTKDPFIKFDDLPKCMGYVGRIKRIVDHQDIGGKEFILDEFISKDLTPEKVQRCASTGNYACYNFIMRRPDFLSKCSEDLWTYKLYYVKVDGLGYIIAHDEIDGEIAYKEIK